MFKHGVFLKFDKIYILKLGIQFYHFIKSIFILPRIILGSKTPTMKHANVKSPKSYSNNYIK